MEIKDIFCELPPKGLFTSGGHDLVRRTDVILHLFDHGTTSRLTHRNWHHILRQAKINW